MAHDGMIAVVDALFQPAALIDSKGRVQHANAAATARFGLQPALTCHEVLHRREARCAECPLDDVCATHAVQTCCFDRDGVRLGLRLAPLYDGLVLATLAEASPLAGLQDQLSRAGRLAGLGTLAAGVAHEFNNVLAAIQGRAEIIVRSASTAPPLVSECARAIVRHSRRGAEIIDQINSLAATRPVRPVAVRWEDVLEEVLTSLAPWLAEENITVARDYTARRAVSADVGQVHQLVLNVLQNARDAIRPQGQGTIRVGTRDLVDGVALDIADTGMGMDELTRHRLFEPFYSTKGLSERRADLGTGLGLGLGLAIVHGVVRAHDGRIEVASTPGRGTRLTVVFPATLEPVEFGRSAPVAVDAAPHTLRVTVVDDDPDVTETISLALATRGGTALQVNDGQRAVEACVEVEADVILIDRFLRPLDGLNVLREIRRRGVQTPAVLLSGRRADEDPELLRSLGVRRRLQKPVGLAELFAAIDEACAGAAGAEGPGGTTPAVSGAGGAAPAVSGAGGTDPARGGPGNG
jgi:two-component system, NtrC family, sensor kinase